MMYCKKHRQLSLRVKYQTNEARITLNIVLPDSKLFLLKYTTCNLKIIEKAWTLSCSSGEVRAGSRSTTVSLHLLTIFSYSANRVLITSKISN